MKRKISLSLAVPNTLNKKFKLIQKDLKKTIGIKNYMINNPSLHINILSGELHDRELRKLYSIKFNQNISKSVDFMGFGIFLNFKNNNVLYSRFSNTSLIYSIRTLLLKKIYKKFDLVDDTASKKLWIPKATLAMRDFPVSKINKVAKIISKYNFDKKKYKSNYIFIIDYTVKEKIIKKIKI
tara:strand:- start:248 stop:793 length:546 start_codon:yes stop_codon:yes gene_type:complete